jgi:hypothetical protein
MTRPRALRHLAAAIAAAALALSPAAAQDASVRAVIDCGSLSGSGRVHIHVGASYLGTVTVHCNRT